MFCQILEMSAVDEMSKQKVEEVSQVVKQDCQPCRYLGTGLFLFTASYIWYHTKGAFYRGSLYKRIPLRVAAVGWFFFFFDFF